MMKCAAHCPTCSPKQKPSAAMPLRVGRRCVSARGRQARRQALQEGAPKDHLGPAKDREALADDAMRLDDRPAHGRPLEDMQLEEDAHGGLRHEVPPQVARHVRVSRRVELAAGVVVPEVVAAQAEDDAERLERHVEARAGDAEDHACRRAGSVEATGVVGRGTWAHLWGRASPSKRPGSCAGRGGVSVASCPYSGASGCAPDVPLDGRVEGLLVDKVVLVRPDVDIVVLRFGEGRGEIG